MIKNKYTLNESMFGRQLVPHLSQPIRDYNILSVNYNVAEIPILLDENDIVSTFTFLKLPKIF